MSTAPVRPSRAIDSGWRERALKVIPNGMYGHLRTARLGPDYPQFMARGEGARIWDVDGREFIDLMCTFGPILLGHAHPEVVEAVRSAVSRGTSFGTPTEGEVALAEEIVARVEELQRLTAFESRAVGLR